MKRIHVRYIGPITDSGEITISPVTVFCGRQGSGKSTLAKLISTCMWLEKALMKNELTLKYVTSFNRFRKKFCAYHGLEDFFNEESFLRYDSERFSFLYEHQHLTIEEHKEADYLIPKIMYIPAERNFMVAIEHAERVRNLPSSLQTLQTEYIKALQSLKVPVSLPIDGVKVQYDRLNKMTWFNGAGFHVKAQNAASGFQSVAPLALVSGYLSHLVEGQKDSTPISAEEHAQLREKINKILSNKKLSEEVKNIMIEDVNKRFTLDSFVNIVEEPEQNLYPSSQRNVLNMLLTYRNRKSHNMLIITTHSPYILDYLSLNMKACQVARTVAPEKKIEIRKIVSESSWINPGDVTIYEIQEDGSTKTLENYEGIPSDDNFLNNALAEINDLYSQLIEIEDE